MSSLCECGARTGQGGIVLGKVQGELGLVVRLELAALGGSVRALFVVYKEAVLGRHQVWMALLERLEMVAVRVPRDVRRVAGEPGGRRCDGIRDAVLGARCGDEETRRRSSKRGE